MYDAIATTYAQQIDSYVPTLERDKFDNFFQKGAKILDVGCAAGRDSFYFVSKGLDVVGVDLSEKLLDIAKTKLKDGQNPRFVLVDLRALPFQKGTFDGVWACASLLHLKRSEVPMVLRRFFQLLKPNGVLFIMVKAGMGEADVAEELPSHLSRHFTYFEQNGLKNLLEDAGFARVEQYTHNKKDRRPDHRDLWWISSFSRKP